MQIDCAGGLFCLRTAYNNIMTTTKKLHIGEVLAALRNGDCLETTSATEIVRLELIAKNAGVETYTAQERRDTLVYVIWAI